MRTQQARDYQILQAGQGTAHFLPHRQEPFAVIGRLIPLYDGARWSYREELFPAPSTKTFADDQYDLGQVLRGEAQAIFLAVRGDCCIGSVRVSLDWFGRGYVESLAVNAAERHGGVGRALLDTATGWCRSKGAKALLLEAQDNNLLACRFYLKYGFSLCGIHTRRYALTRYQDETSLDFYLPLAP